MRICVRFVLVAEAVGKGMERGKGRGEVGGMGMASLGEGGGGWKGWEGAS